MSLFTKVVYRSGLTPDVEHVFEKLAEAIAEVLRKHTEEIAELREEIARLKAEPRTSLAQKIRSRK